MKCLILILSSLKTWCHKTNAAVIHLPGQCRETAAESHQVALDQVVNEAADVEDQPAASSPRQQIQLDADDGKIKIIIIIMKKLCLFSAAVTQQRHHKTKYINGIPWNSFQTIWNIQNFTYSNKHQHFDESSACVMIDLQFHQTLQAKD